MVAQSELDKYYASISKELHCTSDEKQHILDALRFDIEEYLIDFPDTSLENLISRFGTPESIAKEHLQDMSTDEICQKMRSANFVKRAILIALIAIIVIAVALAIGIAIYNSCHTIEYIGDEVLSIKKIY